MFGKEMNADDLFSASGSVEIGLQGARARQAVDSLRGYAYQVLATTLAWRHIGDDSRLVLEVAEDYAILADQALRLVQIKDTEGSGTVTLNSAGVRKAVESFVRFSTGHPDIQVELRYFTTSEIGMERATSDRPARIAGLQYWHKVGGQRANDSVAPLRTLLESERFPEPVREFCKARDDEELRRDLIQRIVWECGKPGLSTLREQLEASLIVLGRKRFGLPAPEARRLADPLICRVLAKSINKTPRDRTLSRADLYSTIDDLTHVTVPRAAINALAEVGTQRALSLSGGLIGRESFTVAESGWLVYGGTLAGSEAMIPRTSVESAVVEALRSFGIAVLAGSSGVGKSIVARAVAGRNSCGFAMADFRYADANESRHRLDMVFARIGGLRSSALIIEDLNCIDDQRVAVPLARVIEAARRHHCEVLITCHRSPSWSVLTQSGVDRRCAVNVPYFSEEEARALVASNGGDPDIWARLAFLAGSGGHPQLTHAFVIGMMAQGWPVEETTRDIIKKCLLSNDIDAARAAARRYVVSALPEGTRKLLYRLSLTIGGFSRSLALAIGELPPAVSQPGECMDQLVGPWIESIAEDRFRVSPLAVDFGRNMLSPGEQKSVHETFAVQMAEHRSIAASDANTMMMHAIAGNVPQILVAISRSVLAEDSHTLEMLAEHLYLFRFSKVDEPMYPEDSKTSWVLKLAQFRLAAAAGDGKRVSDIVTALFRDVVSLPNEERDSLEVMALLVVLSTVGVANHVDDWLSLLHRLKSMVESNNLLQALTSSVPHDSGSDLFGVMFSIGSANLASVRRLERIINELDKLDESVRALWLTPIDRAYSDYFEFISGPWTHQQGREHERFDAADAATRYERMASTTRNWLTGSVSLQCSVAQAVMLDEYQNDKEGALRVLREAISTVGEDPILGRALANVYLRHSDYRSALDIYRDIAAQISVYSAVGRAFTLRKAAISAAECGEWSQAQEWFVEAEAAAEEAAGDDMAPMAIGLRADSAVAAFEAGNTGEALARVADAVHALSDLDPDESLRAAYCHHVVRHSALWMLSRIGGNAGTIYGRAISLEAGSCSNPEPPPAIREHPLGHIDIVLVHVGEGRSCSRHRRRHQGNA